MHHRINVPISEEETRVRRSIPRYDLFARVQRLEDTMFSKTDAKEMERRMDIKSAAMEKRMDIKSAAMEKRMDGKFLITTSISLVALLNSLRSLRVSSLQSIQYLASFYHLRYLF